MIESLDATLLARVQFAFTISFHIVFPAFTIGLASWLAVLEWRWLSTTNPVYADIYRMWVKIFAVTFGMGVVSGVVMSFQFGTNWSLFADKGGNVLGPLLGYEVLTAFFLEASFLGVMLFGWNRVSPRMHFAATLIVAAGTLISAFWILSANSWMQTPAGFRAGEDGLLYPTNWLRVIFNPSFPYRFAHMVTAAYLTTAFVAAGIGAFYLWRQRHGKHARVMLGMAMIMAIFVAPMQLLFGDLHGLNTLEHQPVKVSAMEGLWDTQRGAPLMLFGWPDEKEEVTKYGVRIPKLSSLILTHDFDGEVKGLKEWPKDKRPPVAWVFWSFRIMVGLGLLMIATGLTGLVLYVKKRLFNTRWFQYWCMALTPAGFVAVLAGWFVTEVGRQPYIVYGLLRTAESASPVPGTPVALSLVAFVITYVFVFGAGSYYILRVIGKGPERAERAYGDHGVRKPPIITGLIERERETGMFSFDRFLDLPLIWYGLIAISIFLYVLLDGFDLGVGILFPFAPSDQCRDRMMNSITPFWDGNETWLVLGGGGLFAAFPLAYSVLMPALYIPVLLMLQGIIFRGVAFEFRSKATGKSRRIWDYAFHFGSLLAAFMQGAILGAFVLGLAVKGRSFAGGTFDWLNAYSVMTGVALIFGYALLGATWLVLKTDQTTQRWARNCASYALGYVGLFLAIVSISMPIMNQGIRRLWFSLPNLFLLLPIPTASLVLIIIIWRNLYAGKERSPFFLSFGVFLTGYLGLGISLWPWIVPFEITFRQAAAAPPSQSLLLVGTLILLPLVLTYTGYIYYIFRGKVSDETGY